MKPKRTATVSKKLSDDTLKNNARWNFFVEQCQIAWDDLSEEAKDFYCAMGNTQSKAEDINKAIDKAIIAVEKDSK
jgi:hypothetical protein